MTKTPDVPAQPDSIDREGARRWLLQVTQLPTAAACVNARIVLTYDDL
ncbi:MAG: hypothetical protein AAGG07_06825 [Planctomycetota bacterium]